MTSIGVPSLIIGSYWPRMIDWCAGGFSMRVVLGTLLAGLVLVATVRAGEDAAKKELKKLNGTWIAIALEKNGEKLGEK